MSKRIYNWKRFWCTKDKPFNLSDNGFLINPELSWTYKKLDCNLVSIDEINDIPCLILLGEAGIGKSREIENQYSKMLEITRDTNDKILKFDLGKYKTESYLMQDIFNNPKFQNWLSGNHRLYLFLDSLDEGLLEIKTLVRLLTEELANYRAHFDRFYFRISCRTGVWNDTYEQKFTDLWGESSIGVYKLAPLRQIDIITALEDDGINIEDFFASINEKEVIPFAILPVTLNFLLNLYRKEAKLPVSKYESYYEGCKLLCEETNEDRRVSDHIGNLSAEERLIIASRIAAITIFSNRFFISSQIDYGDESENFVKVNEVCGGNERNNGDEFPIDEKAIKETLAISGLFSSLGSAFVWAHKSYAEFLAAWYLMHHKVQMPQIKSLILHSDQKLIPQLYETASWLAGKNVDLFREIIQIEPEVLLNSDVIVDDGDKKQLVENLLNRLDKEELFDNFSYRDYYHKLQHSRLTPQLKSYILDKTKSLFCRRAAIDIAEICNLEELQNNILQIVLDSSEEYHLRTRAAHAIKEIGSIESKLKLKPFLNSSIEDDPDDELKGYALQALFPDFITPEEVFSVLTSPKNGSLFGAYSSFINYYLKENLKKEHLISGLEWVKSQPLIEKSDNFKDDLENNDELRRNLLNTMFPLLENPKEEWVYLFSRTQLIFEKDKFWLLDRIVNESSKKIQQVLSKLISRVHYYEDTEFTNKILNLCNENKILADEFSSLINPVMLNSPKAEKMKKDYYKRQEWDKPEEKKLLEPPPLERVLQLLDRFESGEFGAWWYLTKEMTLKPDSQYYGDLFESNLTVLPVWQQATLEIKNRIIQAAYQYFEKAEPQNEKWLGEKVYHWPSIAGYKALRLILINEPDYIENIDVSLWKKWAATILNYSDTDNNEDAQTIQNDLIKFAYQNAPNEFIHALSILIDKDNDQFDHIFITRRVQHCWDNQIANVLFKKVQDDNLKISNKGCLLEDLLSHNFDKAKKYAVSLTKLISSENEEDRKKAFIAIQKLIENTYDAGWADIWPIIEQNLGVGKSIFLMVAQTEAPGNRLATKLSENQLVELYLWLSKQFPHSEDPEKPNEVHTPTPRMLIKDWRDKIIFNLKQRGTAEACDAIETIAKELPDLKWIKWRLTEAQKITRIKNWQPLNPNEILKLVNNSHLRVVQNGEQLLQIIIESLEYLQRKLQERNAVQFLWNEDKPKDENSLSDYVKLHLEEDLKDRKIILNREAEVRRGQETDIKIETFLKDNQGQSDDLITFIIETKGCWHKEVNEAMEIQLVERYLKTNGLKYGLYLVGWFYCDKWQKDDYKKNETKKLLGEDIHQARKKFEKQAEELSKQGLHIKSFVLDCSL